MVENGGRNGSAECHAHTDMSTGMTLKVKRSKPAKPDLSQNISRLKSRWNDLHDLDRALEIDFIHRSGISINQIGRKLEL